MTRPQTGSPSSRRCSVRRTERLDEAVPLIAALLGVPSGERYPPLEPQPAAAEAAHPRGLIEQLAGLARERPVLELYEDVHWVDPSTLELLDLLVERVRALPVLRRAHLPARVQPALDRAEPCHGADHQPPRPRQGAAMVDAGHRRQDAAGRGARPDRGQDRRRAAVRRGADQDGAGVGPAARCRRPLRARRPAAAARDPGDPARLADGPARPPRPRSRRSPRPAR